MTDDQHGAYQATLHLLALGHRHLLHFFPSPGDEVYGKRLLGIRQALLEYGLDPDRHQQALPLPYGWHDPGSAPMQLTPEGLPRELGENAREMLLRFLGAHPEITAIIAPNDGAALHIWHVLHWAGRRVQEEYSLIGFDDTDAMPDEHGRNLLTTVRLPLVEVGRSAAALFLRRLHGAAAEEEHLLLPTELILRASTAPPRPE